jgi:hypothetical protein
MITSRPRTRTPSAKVLAQNFSDDESPPERSKPMRDECDDSDEERPLKKAKKKSRGKQAGGSNVVARGSAVANYCPPVFSQQAVPDRSAAPPKKGANKGLALNQRMTLPPQSVLNRERKVATAKQTQKKVQPTLTIKSWYVRREFRFIIHLFPIIVRNVVINSSSNLLTFIYNIYICGYTSI